MRVCPRCGSTYQLDPDHCGIDGTPLVVQDSDPLIGRLVDRYHVEAKLGEGGMGCVYRVRHGALGRIFAMKVLYGDMASQRVVAERFRREAMAAGRIIHPNVVAVTDFGTTESGITFMVMELIEGRTLAQVLGGHPLTQWRACRIARQIALALAEAHRQGFVHRDLKPANVMLVGADLAEQVKVLDFGVVGIRSEVEGSDRLTRSGLLVGTPLYMAPEQISGAPAHPSIDLYALGAILHEMLSGQPPFPRESVQQVLTAHLTELPPGLAGQTEIETLAQRLLEKRPEDRPASAEAVVAEIDRALAPAEGAAPDRPPSATRDTGVPDARFGRYGLGIGLAMLVAAVAIAAAAALSASVRSPEPTTMATALAVSSTSGDPVEIGVGPIEMPPPPLEPPTPPARSKPDRAVTGERPVPKTPGRAQPVAARRSSQQEITARLQAALRGRGWTLTDLEGVPAARSSVRAFRAAVERGEASEASLRALVDLLEGVRSNEILEARISRLRLALESARARVPLDAYSVLEDRFLDLETDRDQARDERTLGELLHRAAGLETDIQNARARLR